MADSKKPSQQKTQKPAQRSGSDQQQQAKPKSQTQKDSQKKQMS